MIRSLRWFAVAMLLGATGALQAQLPSHVEGEPLPSLAPMLERTTPAVVNIATAGRTLVPESPLLQDPFFRHFFDLPERPRERRTQSLGSGVIVDAERGHILTNHHVIRHADTITVTLADGRALNATVVGSDPGTDVAVIRVDADDLHALPLADSDELRVGDFVVAIGNPFGLGQTVTSGIVSALGRSGLQLNGYQDFIQTDASINPGNSGGALVNLRGELVGINTAILSPAGGNVGIGFAIPTNMAQAVMEQLVEYGEVTRGRLGVGVQNLTPELARAFDLEARSGVVVTQVVPDSAADRAGLEAGDIVVSVNNRRISDTDDLRNAVGLLRAGETARLVLRRNGEELRIDAVLDAPEERTVEGGRVHPRLEGARFGMDESVRTDARGASAPVAVLAVEPGSPSHEAGLREGDVVLSVNRQAVANLEAFRNLVEGAERLLFHVRRDGGALFLVIR